MTIYRTCTYKLPPLGDVPVANRITRAHANMGILAVFDEDGDTVQADPNVRFVELQADVEDESTAGNRRRFRPAGVIGDYFDERTGELIIDGIVRIQTSETYTPSLHGRGIKPSTVLGKCKVVVNQTDLDDHVGGGFGLVCGGGTDPVIGEYLTVYLRGLARSDNT